MRHIRLRDCFHGLRQSKIQTPNSSIYRKKIFLCGRLKSRYFTHYTFLPYRKICGIFQSLKKMPRPDSHFPLSFFFRTQIRVLFFSFKTLKIQSVNFSHFEPKLVTNWNKNAPDISRHSLASTRIRIRSRVPFPALKRLMHTVWKVGTISKVSILAAVRTVQDLSGHVPGQNSNYPYHDFRRGEFSDHFFLLLDPFRYKHFVVRKCNSLLTFVMLFNILLCIMHQSSRI